MTDQPPTTIPPHQQAGYDAVYEVIRAFPGEAERNAVIWRAVEAYRTASEAEQERQVRARLAAEIEAEALDMDPGREATDADHLPGLAGNSYWRAMCEANGLWRAVNVARKDTR